MSAAVSATTDIVDASPAVKAAPAAKPKAKRVPPPKRAAAPTKTAASVAAGTSTETVATDAASTTAVGGETKPAVGARVAYNARNLKRYVHLVVKKHFPKLLMSKESVECAQDVVLYLVQRVCDNISILLDVNRGPKTLKVATMQAAIHLVFVQTRDIYKNGIQQAQNGLKRFETARDAQAAFALENAERKKRGEEPVKPLNKAQSTSQKAGLLLPATRIRHILKDQVRNKQISSGVDVLLTGMLEYVILELVDLARMVVEKDKRKMVRPFDFVIGLANDADELYVLLHDVMLGHGTGHGVVPGIVPAIEKDQYKKHELMVSLGLIDDIPAELKAKQRKKKNALALRKKRKQADGEPMAEAAPNPIPTAVPADAKPDAANAKKASTKKAPPAKRAKKNDEPVEASA